MVPRRDFSMSMYALAPQIRQPNAGTSFIREGAPVIRALARPIPAASRHWIGGMGSPRSSAARISSSTPKKSGTAFGVLPCSQCAAQRRLNHARIYPIRPEMRRATCLPMRVLNVMEAESGRLILQCRAASRPAPSGSAELRSAKRLEANMPRGRADKPVEQYASITAKVARYEVRARAGLNLNLVTHLPLNDDLDQPVFTFSTRLLVRAICTYPEDRAGQIYEFNLSALDGSDAVWKLKHIQTRDKHDLPMYRQYRGRHLPVFKKVHGMALLERQRGTHEFTAWVSLDPRLVSDWLALLNRGGALYLAIDETKVGRNRWLRSLSLQTTDPSEE